MERLLRWWNRGGITPTSCGERDRVRERRITLSTPMAYPVPSSSSSSSTPTSCDMISRIHVKSRWLIRLLAWVRATLDDGEDMNTTDKSILDWLRQLQEVADAAEDLLDEFPPEALGLGFVGDGGGWNITVGSITELPRQGMMGSEMDRLHDQRMEDIVSIFMKIKKPVQALELDFPEEQMDDEKIHARRATSPVMKEPYIVGRIAELAQIKQFLLSSDTKESRGSDDMDDPVESGGSDDMDDHVSVMAIVGMGGLGKTTLAQLAYNDPQVNQHFQLKSWVCVSEDFDVVRLTKAMLQSLNVEASGLSELDPLHRKLVKRLSGQERYLLVLDDVWEAENLNIHSWNTLIAPLRNIFTKIIMTTRSRKVSEIAPTTLTYDLDFLSDEDTLELFMRHAFEGRDPNLCQNLVNVAKETARKCRGVPLVAKTVGGLLHNKDDEEWNKILKSEVWNATINQEDSIIPILKLSYQHLPAPLKRCFRYCSLFPKDHVFYRNRIIRMWMAQGYIKANRRELMEDIGQRYIDNLLLRSFFQNCPRNPEGLQMHDLMHDLARCVSAGECYSMEGGKSCLIPSNVRHLSFFGTGFFPWTITSVPKSCRSLLITYPNLHYLKSHVSLLISVLCISMEHLRVLDLGGNPLDHWPESIARLKHLRYLRISGLFVELPEFVGSMYHLQTLDLEGVFKLPSMSNLLNLRHLSGRVSLDYPVGIGKLTNLQTMPGFHVSPKIYNHAKLGELKDMNNIRGVFAISGLENLADANEAKKACLGNKRNISSLHLEWDPQAASSSIDEEVLESLKPSIKLASLRISGFKGLSYPSWLGHRSFSRLVIVKLELCENCFSLPPLGQLPLLKSLYVSEARAVEYIGGGFFSGGFPQLEELTLRKMDNWKSWCGAQEGECPKLKKLSIFGCPNLESLPPLGQLPSLKSLSVSKARAVEYISSGFFSGGFPQLEELTLSEMDNWKSWCGAQEGEFPKLKKLSIDTCPNLESLPPLGQLPSLKSLSVSKARAVEYIGSGFFSGGFPQLEELTLREMDNWKSWCGAQEGQCPKLKKLSIDRCPNLESLSLINLGAFVDMYVSIGGLNMDCPLELSCLQHVKRIEHNRTINHGLCIEAHISPAVLSEYEPHLQLDRVDQQEAEYILAMCSHICGLTVKKCVQLTRLPLGNQSAMKYVEISDCRRLRITSVSPQLWQLPSLQRIHVQRIHGAVSIKIVRASYVELTNVDQLVASALLKEFSHMICRLVITRCVNLTSLPWTDLTTLEYLRISECPLFQLLDAEQLPSTLQVLCIYGNPYETEQCSRHQHFQRLKQVQQCSTKEGGEQNLYLVFRNVRDASAASKFCSEDFLKIHTLDIEWDCCSNDGSISVTDAITQEVLFNLYSLCISTKELVIRGYTGSVFAGCYADFSSKTLRIDVFRSTLSYVSLLQCSKCDLAPLGRLPFLRELYVEGASSLETVALDCLVPYDAMSEQDDDMSKQDDDMSQQERVTGIAFPCLQKLEFHDMPVWKEWLGTKKGDFQFLMKLVLKHCPKLRALPRLPPRLKELILEGCKELQSLSSSSQGLKSLRVLSVTNCPNLYFTATEGPPPRLELMSLTGCPLLLAWCEGHPRMLASLNYFYVDGVLVSLGIRF